MNKQILSVPFLFQDFCLTRLSSRHRPSTNRWLVQQLWRWLHRWKCTWSPQSCTVWRLLVWGQQLIEKGSKQTSSLFKIMWKTNDAKQTSVQIPPLTDNCDFSRAHDFVVDLCCVVAAVLYSQVWEGQRSSVKIKLTPI